MDRIRDPRQIVSNVAAIPRDPQALAIERNDFLPQQEVDADRLSPPLQDHSQQNQRDAFRCLWKIHVLAPPRPRSCRVLTHTRTEYVFGYRAAFEGHLPDRHTTACREVCMTRPAHQEDAMRQDDPLDAARGIAAGVAIMLPAWALLFWWVFA